MAFNYENLKNPGYFEENRVLAHSDHIPYASFEELEAGNSSLRYSLNGSWKFFYALNEQQVIPGFESSDYDCHPWADIPVPAHIQMEGYGVPQYCNTQYPWDGYQSCRPGELPERFNPVACYTKYFYLPESMKGKRVFISFQGAESCVAVWLNGQYIGFSSDSFTPSDFELTDALVEGENKLSCRVYRWSAGSWVEDQDFMRFSGLFRDVFLYAKPNVHIEDIRITTSLDDEYKDAILDVKLRMEAPEGWQVLLALRDGESTVVEATQSGDLTTASFSLPVSNPKKWSSEKPNLYQLVLCAASPDGSIQEVVCEPVGFRRFEIRDSIMLLNGQRIVFKGTNRHDFCAETGRAVTPEKIRRDLINMKRNNINAVRTSHYPNHSALYALCDELGLYVIDENNMESHGLWDMVNSRLMSMEDMVPGNREEWKDLLLDRVNSTYQRDKNHPCILIWSCGNESMGGDVIYEMSQLFRSLDSTRPVHYEGVEHDPRRLETTDILSQMYTPLAQVREILAERRDKPFLLCEYTHSMGNSNGAMHKYTEYAYEEPLYQGGFIWDYLDQSIRSKDRYGNTIYNYGGDNGEQPHDGNFCGNGIVYGNGEPSEKMQAVKYNYQNIVADVTADTIHIRNRSMFTSTSEFECIVSLARNGEVLEEVLLETDVAPLSEGTYDCPFRKRTSGGEYTITLSFRLKESELWAERGYEVAFAQGAYTTPAEISKVRHEPLRIVQGTNNLGIHGECFEVLFNYMSGGLVSYRYAGKEMLKTMPRPNFWRAPTDNDRGWFMPQQLGQWKLASLYAMRNMSPDSNPFENLRPPVTQNPDGSVSITFDMLLPTAPKATCSLAYTVNPCGKVDVRLDYDPVEGLPPMPEFGVMLKMDADFDQVRWYGLGPDENYIDRQAGARLGIYEHSIKEFMTDYLIPQECGNRTGVRYAEVTDFRGRGLRFEGDAMEFSALPYTPHELENAQHAYELPPVHYTVIRAAKMQMGVAGDNSWGARPHEEYMLDPKSRQSFSFSFRGIL